MDKIDWKSMISAIAPILGTALGGPLVGAATAEISNILLGKAQSTDEELTKAMLSVSPETIVKLKEAEQQFSIRIQELKIDLEKISFENVKSARERETKIAEYNKSDRTPKVLAYLAIIGFFAVMYALFIKTLPEGLPRDAFLILLGTLTKIVSDLYNYYFGSSAGSSRKTEIMVNNSKTQ